MFPPNRQMKFNAKLSMAKTMAFWIKATILLVAITVAADILIAQFGGFLGRLIIDSVEANPEMVTGLSTQGDKILILARLDILGMLAGFVTSISGLKRFLLFGGIFFLLVSPMKIGIIELYWKAFRGEEVKSREILNWYKRPGRMIKAIVIQAVAGIGSLVLGAIALAPGYILYFFTYSGAYVGPGQEQLLTVLGLLAMTALFIGLLLSFFCYAMLTPLAYCLAAQPQYSILQVFRKGFASIKGVTKKYFYFRLSLLPWHIVSNFTYGVAEMYIRPYVTFSSLHFLQEAARYRQSSEQEASHIE